MGSVPDPERWPVEQLAPEGLTGAEAAGLQQGLGAIVLSGGRGRRLGGADKATLQLSGETLLDRALTATAVADPVVVVGDPLPTTRRVQWTREVPPGGGPAAALLAGLDRLATATTIGPAIVLVLAVDMPLVTPDTVSRLVRAAQSAPTADGAVLVDSDGRRQPLCAAYRSASLHRTRASLPAPVNGLSMRDLIGNLSLVAVAEIGGEARDIDTWTDLTEVTAQLRSESDLQ